MQKEVYRSNKIESKVKQLEKDNLYSKIKQNTTETLIIENIEELLNKIKILEPKENIVLPNPVFPPNRIVHKTKYNATIKWP